MAAKKRTRRAVNARRTLDQREGVALQKLDHWLDVLERATTKVKLYRRELQRVRTLKAGKVGDAVFGDLLDGSQPSDGEP